MGPNATVLCEYFLLATSDRMKLYPDGRQLTFGLDRALPSGGSLESDLQLGWAFGKLYALEH